MDAHALASARDAACVASRREQARRIDRAQGRGGSSSGGSDGGRQQQRRQRQLQQRWRAAAAVCAAARRLLCSVRLAVLCIDPLYDAAPVRKRQQLGRCTLIREPVCAGACSCSCAGDMLLSSRLLVVGW